MARLLARSRTGSPESSPPVASISQTNLRLPNQTDEPSNGTTVPAAPDHDRSHLTAEPIHKQDKQAVRENLQSFRQVAHLSARSALARHSLRQLRNATIAKGTLLGASAIAATVFFTEQLWGGQLQLWKGIGCSLASLLAALEFRRSWSQWHQPFKVPPELARDAVSDRTEEPPAGPILGGDEADSMAPASAHRELVELTPAPVPSKGEPVPSADE